MSDTLNSKKPTPVPGFKKYIIPKAASSTSAVTNPPSSSGEPVLVAIQNKPKFTPAVSTAIVTELKPKKGNLRISDSAFKTITSYIDKLKPLFDNRAHHRRSHDHIGRRQNDNCPVTWVIEKPPAQFNQEPYDPSFLISYRAQALIVSNHLSQLLVTEHANQVSRRSEEILAIKQQAEESLYLIIDNDEQAKAHRLFQVKFEGLSRSSKTPHGPRRHLKPKRRLPSAE